MRVTAVLRDLPSNTNLVTEVFASARSAYSVLSAMDAGAPAYGALEGFTFVRLKPGVPPAELQRALDAATGPEKAMASNFSAGAQFLFKPLALGDAHNRSGQADAAKAAFLEAAERARDAARPDLFAQAAIGFGGYVPIGVDIADPQALALLEEALTMLGDEDSPARAIALSRLAQARYRSSAAAERSWQIDEALDIARRVGNPNTLGAVLLARHWTFYGPDDLEERVACADEIVSLGEEFGENDLFGEKFGADHDLGFGRST